MTDPVETPKPTSLPDRECRDWSEECEGEVEWQVDGAKRCGHHQRVRDRQRRKQGLVSWTVAALVVVAVGLIVNVIIQPDDGPSQARAWDECEDYAAVNLDLPTGARFAQFPANPSDRVKLQLGSNRYTVYSYYETPDTQRREFLCTVSYLGGDDWQIVDLAVAPEPLDH